MQKVSSYGFWWELGLFLSPKYWLELTEDLIKIGKVTGCLQNFVGLHVLDHSTVSHMSSLSELPEIKMIHLSLLCFFVSIMITEFYVRGRSLGSCLYR